MDNGNGTHTHIYTDKDGTVREETHENTEE